MLHLYFQNYSTETNPKSLKFRGHKECRSPRLNVQFSSQNVSPSGFKQAFNFWCNTSWWMTVVPEDILSQNNFQGHSREKYIFAHNLGPGIKKYGLHSTENIYIGGWQYILCNIGGVSTFWYYMYLGVWNCRLSCSPLAVGPWNLHRRCIYALHSLSQKFRKTHVFVF